MARKRRIWYPGATYHVMSRGNNKNKIFRDERDYQKFMSILTNVQIKHPFTLISYCLMTNHYHLQITTLETPISIIMQNLNTTYSKKFNYKYNLVGHVFQGRYTSRLITNKKYFHEVSRYIHLNPVKAQIVSDPLDYKWSSYSEYMDPANAEYTDPSWIFDNFYGDSIQGYKEFVESKISHEEDEEQIRKDMNENVLWLPYH